MGGLPPRKGKLSPGKKKKKSTTTIRGGFHRKRCSSSKVGGPAKPGLYPGLEKERPLKTSKKGQRKEV